MGFPEVIAETIINWRKNFQKQEKVPIDGRRREHGMFTTSVCRACGSEWTWMCSVMKFKPAFQNTLKNETFSKENVGRIPYPNRGFYLPCSPGLHFGIFEVIKFWTLLPTLRDHWEFKNHDKSKDHWIHHLKTEQMYSKNTQMYFGIK